MTMTDLGSVFFEEMLSDPSVIRLVAERTGRPSSDVAIIRDLVLEALTYDMRFVVREGEVMFIGRMSRVPQQLKDRLSRHVEDIEELAPAIMDAASISLDELKKPKN